VLVDPGLLFLGLCLILGLVAIVFLLMRLPAPGDDVADQFTDRAALEGRAAPSLLARLSRLFRRR
jgi:hypothetical protein